MSKTETLRQSAAASNETRLERWVKHGYLDEYWTDLDHAIERAVEAKNERRALSVGVLGNGNVALDVARMLAGRADRLAGTETSPAALAAQVARVRALEESSRPGIAMLSPDSQPCIEAARVLYCGIVDEVERIDYEVFDKRATVPLRRRLAVAGPAWVRARRARRRSAA